MNVISESSESTREGKAARVGSKHLTIGIFGASFTGQLQTMTCISRIVGKQETEASGRKWVFGEMTGDAFRNPPISEPTSSF